MNPNKEIDALISLLDDPDKEVYVEVFNNLINKGTEIIPALEKAWEMSPNQFIQERLENIIHKIHFESVKAEIIRWNRSNKQDIIEGAFWIAKYQFPEISFTEIINFIEKMVKEIWLEINKNLTAYEKINVINHIFFQNYKFKSIINLLNPHNYYINRVIETKKGSPVALGIIYSGIAQRLNLPVYGVDLPNSFILAYLNDDYSFLNKDKSQDILFYINPSNSGIVFSKSEISAYLKTMKIDSSEDYFMPASPQKIIKRLIEELIIIYEKNDNDKKINDLETIFGLLD
jgi:regulator of sirC expression with transglutaminase-like and TPR domain